MIRTHLFQYPFACFGAADIGRTRKENQDTVILCPQEGFFAVSDGMGGLAEGGQTSRMIAQVMPQMLAENSGILADAADPGLAAALLQKLVGSMSDSIYRTANKGKRAGFGATVSGVWLVGDRAVFVNLGDSRGYLLPAGGGSLRQVTVDHNLAQMMVAAGKLSKAEARHHHTSSQLTCYAGMPSPAVVDTFVETVAPDTKILLCSDGLHGMVDDAGIEAILRDTGPADQIGRQLIGRANACGGHDNISVVVIDIRPGGASSWI